MLGRERRKQILDRIAARGAIGIVELSEELGVSESTVRRDLGDLAAQDLIERVHGGAVAKQGEERPTVERARHQAAAKAAIGATAAQLVKPDSTILIAGGTTTAAMLPRLASVAGLTIITNSLDLAWAVAHRTSADLIVLGGQLRRGEGSLLGQTELSLRELNPDQAFFGCFGISGRQGLTGTSMLEVVTDRIMIAACPELVVVADHTKFSQRGPVVITPADELSTLVTDRPPPPEDAAELDAKGVSIIVADDKH